MDRDHYLERMRNCAPFKYFGIVPVWRPGETDIEGFVHDEVVRQDHDPRVWDDGGTRVAWMLHGWNYALMNGYNRAPSIEDVLTLGTYVEPKVNARGFRDVEVYIGKSRGAPSVIVPQLVTWLVTHAERMTPLLRRGGGAPHPAEIRAQWDFYPPDTALKHVPPLLMRMETATDWYLAYEAIHPFADGNGRTGKILHNWLLRTLDQPELVADFFGGGNP
jgi:hypothetical protein